MPVTSKVFFRGSASTTNTTLYTAPNTTTVAVVTNVIATNTTASSSTFTVNLDTVAIASSAPIAANTTAIFDIKQVIPANNPAKTISGSAATTGITFNISGVEIS